VLTESYARSWRWDEDGPVAEGEHIRFDEAQHDGRDIGIHVLRVAGEERSIWVFWLPLAAKIGDELARRPSGDLDPGERVRYARAPKKVTSGNGREYWPFTASFGNSAKYKRSPNEIFRPSRPQQDEGTHPGASGEPDGEDDIPFL
jgi:hypothetical protein